MVRVGIVDDVVDVVFVVVVVFCVLILGSTISAVTALVLVLVLEDDMELLAWGRRMCRRRRWRATASLVSLLVALMFSFNLRCISLALSRNPYRM